MTETTGLPIPLTELIRDELGIDTFVETGTGLGRTAAIASDMFRFVYTIEAHQGRWEQARDRFRGSNVACIHGKSPVVLASLLDELDRQCIVFLDAHCAYRDKVTDNACPLLSEIKVVMAANPNHVIFIDDQQSFTSFPPVRECWGEYPELVQVVNAFFDHDRASPFVFIEGKCIVSIPRAIVEAVGEFVTGREND